MRQLCQHVVRGKAPQHDYFVPRTVSAYQLYCAARTIQPFGQQSNQGFVCGSIHRRGGDFDAQFCSQRLANFVNGCARLEFDRQ